MTAYISECGYCHETQFTQWYSKYAPHDMYGRVDRDYLDSQPVAYCSEEHRDAADALRESAAAAAVAFGEMMAEPPAWLPLVNQWELCDDDGSWSVSASLRGADDLGESARRARLEKIAAASGLPVEESGGIVRARFSWRGLAGSVWYVRPVKQWVTPERCATCPTPLAGTGTAFVRLGAGDVEAPVICIPCRDRMHAAWLRRHNDQAAPARAAARALLLDEVGDERPAWRVIYTDSESATGVALVCTADGVDDVHHVIDDHPGGPMRDEQGVYDCCPDTQFETYSTILAAYLVELLNADAEAGEPA